MEVTTHGEQTQILLTREEAKDLCRLGKGANACIRLVVSDKGFECSYYNRRLGPREGWEKGATEAKWDSCEIVEALSQDDASGKIRIVYPKDVPSCPGGC